MVYFYHCAYYSFIKLYFKSIINIFNLLCSLIVKINVRHFTCYVHLNAFNLALYYKINLKLYFITLNKV